MVLSEYRIRGGNADSVNGIVRYGEFQVEGLTAW